jgi:hypothetical protein
MRRRLATMLLLLALSTFAPRAGAEPTPDLTRPRSTSARRHKIQGWVLMSFGIAHFVIATITGFYYLGEDLSCRTDPNCRNEDIASPIAAFTTVCLGGIFTAAGVPVYVSGANALAREKSTPQASLLTVSF